jgi:predicted acyl esterase
VSTSGTDSDWIVKLIDVLPPDTDEPKERRGEQEGAPGPRTPMGGYQMMVRSEVIRGRYRNSYQRPEPFIPNQPTKVTLELLDVLHTFKKGHRCMVQIQSSWFPLVDRNPQKYVDNIFEAAESDFVSAMHRVYRGGENSTRLLLGVLDNSPSPSGRRPG